MNITNKNENSKDQFISSGYIWLDILFDNNWHGSLAVTIVIT